MLDGICHMIHASRSVQEKSQQSDDAEFRQRKITSDMEDLGSRKALEGETDLIWYPAEVNTSIRPGWFYHSAEDDQVKSLEELIHIYVGSVGGNGTFLLNIPPMPNGLLCEKDVERLAEFGQWQKRAFSHNLSENAVILASSEAADHPVRNLTVDSLDCWYQPETSRMPVELVFTLEKPEKVGYLVLKEAIQHSQRVEAFEVSVKGDGDWETVYTGTVIGYKKIVPVFSEKIRKIKIAFRDFRVLPLISLVGIYPEMADDQKEI